MPFPTTIFGRGTVTSPGFINYVDIDSISSGGFGLFIVPTRNVGPAGIDIGFTYVNQFGITKTTTVSTAIEAGTTAGTHIKAVLEPGDTGIRDIISVSYFAGGSTTPAADILSFESWNEGLGRSPIDITITDPFDRTVPGSHIDEPYIGQWKGITYPILSILPIPWYSNPEMSVPIEIIKSSLSAWAPETIIDRASITKTLDFADDIGARKEIVERIPEPFSGRDYTGRTFAMFKSWIESVVGQVLSGYVQNVDGDVIRNAFSMILMSPATDTNPSGVTASADISPDTGLYQAFLKKVVYDQRYIIIKIGVKHVALQGAGIPITVDGNRQLPIPYNLQFACPTIDCDFTITRKV